MRRQSCQSHLGSGLGPCVSGPLGGSGVLTNHKYKSTFHLLKGLRGLISTAIIGVKVTHEPPSRARETSRIPIVPTKPPNIPSCTAKIGLRTLKGGDLDPKP